ncbi:hypothetical protein GGD41_001840 [Paraburkholderia bryophila]|uniref:Transglutaminase-like cysteine protease n=1 Tax=Paraburkholderia bryophila TaxID=420952 RepID=A0A7Y9W602_9BURK|nr:hypothetical protein [Paraburkholderia bryophila]
MNITEQFVQQKRSDDAGRLLRVTHETHYQYSARVDHAHHQACLHPKETPRQRVLDFSLEVRPEPGLVGARTDTFGNRRYFFSLDQPHDELLVCSRSLVQVRAPELAAAVSGATPPAIANPAGCHASAWETVRERLTYRAGQPYDAASEFTYASMYVARHPELARYAAASFTPGRALVQAAWDLMQRIHEDFTYASNSTEVTTTALDALAMRRGVCQDFAHVLIGALRSLGLAAPLCQRLSADPAATRQAAPDRCRRVACVGRSLRSGVARRQRLAATGPDQQPRARRRLRRARDRPRLRGRGAAARRDSRRRQRACVDGGRDRRSARRISGRASGRQRRSLNAEGRRFDGLQRTT